MTLVVSPSVKMQYVYEMCGTTISGFKYFTRMGVKGNDRLSFYSMYTAQEGFQ